MTAQWIYDGMDETGQVLYAAEPIRKEPIETGSPMEMAAEFARLLESSWRPRWIPAHSVTCGQVVGIPTADEDEPIVGVVQAARRLGVGEQIAIEFAARTVIVDRYRAVEVCEL